MSDEPQIQSSGVIEQAMDVMAEQWENYDREASMDSEWDREMSLRLLRAGLLITNETHRVLDAVANWRTQPDSPGALFRLMGEADAWLKERSDDA